MKRFWRRSRPFDLEHELRSARPEPSKDFVRALARRTSGIGRPRVALRLGLAAWLTVGLVVAAASVGGVQASSHSLSNVFNATQVSSKGDDKGDKGDKCGEGDNKNAKRGDDRSDCDQYKEQRKQCYEAIKKADQQEDAAEKKNPPSNDKAEDAQEKANEKAAKDRCKAIGGGGGVEDNTGDGDDDD
jgi:hypothetical protein